MYPPWSGGRERDGPRCLYTRKICNRDNSGRGTAGLGPAARDTTGTSCVLAPIEKGCCRRAKGWREGSLKWGYIRGPYLRLKYNRGLRYVRGRRGRGGHGEISANGHCAHKRAYKCAAVKCSTPLECCRGIVHRRSARNGRGVWRGVERADMRGTDKARKCYERGTPMCARAIDAKRLMCAR